MLGQFISDVRARRLDLKVASTLGYLSSVLLKSIENLRTSKIGLRHRGSGLAGGKRTKRKGESVMTFKMRLQRLEDSLDAKQKFFAWLTKARLVGGFLDYMMQQLHGPMMAEAWREDFDADFLWHLVKDVNFSVLNRIARW